MRKQWISRLMAFVMALVLCLSTVAVALAAYDTIPYGEQSTAVRKMQDALRTKGYYKGAVDGKFGAATKAAVIKFQKAVGITADGKPGNKTLTALYEGKSAINKSNSYERTEWSKPTNPQTLYYGCTGRRVEKLQNALKKAGVYKGNLDGVYGDLTYEAVRKYQRQKGLYVDGMAGTKTLNSLYKNTKDSAAVVASTELIRSSNELGELSRDVAGLAVEMDDYLHRKLAKMVRFTSF